MQTHASMKNRLYKIKHVACEQLRVNKMFLKFTLICMPKRSFGRNIQRMKAKVIL